VLLAGAMLVACSEPPLACESAPSSNVLLYVADTLPDTLRADSLSIYGNEQAYTPAIRDLAREATIFENAYAQSSWTRASVASMLTGIYPDAHGAESRDDRLPELVTLLSEHFDRHGYSTGAIVTNPNVGSFYGFDRGYDEFIQLYARRGAGHVMSNELVARADEVTRRAIEWIESAPHPFFLFVLTVDPHWPYSPPPAFDRYAGNYQGPVRDGEASLMRSDPESLNRERIRASYDSEVSFNISEFGNLVSHLRDTELLDRTTVVFASDHGEEFWEHGGQYHGRTLFEESIRIPLILRCPGGGSAGRRVADRVEAIDLFPTLLELAGLPVPDGVDGRSLLHPTPRSEQTVYATLDLDEYMVRSVVAGPWKLIVDAQQGTRRLFQLEADPAETRDVSAEHPERVADLESTLGERRQTHRARRESLLGGAPGSPPELPDDARATLEALGYIEREDVGPSQ
jgi:arylsulfatase A-like enzyme